MQHTPQNPLYVVGIAAATNLASAILLEPRIVDRIVVIWLGGSGWHCSQMEEFNLMEDVLAAQVLFDSGVALVQLPCWGVVEQFTISKPELEHYLVGKNLLADDLARYAIRDVDSWAGHLKWAKVIWDVTAVAWLLNENQRFMMDRLERTPKIIGASGYEQDSNRPWMRYVYRIERDALVTDLIETLLV
jgi:inosine-uridine nucleoside N-ribohydrolase